MKRTVTGLDGHGTEASVSLGVGVFPLFPTILWRFQIALSVCLIWSVTCGVLILYYVMYKAKCLEEMGDAARVPEPIHRAAF